MRVFEVLKPSGWTPTSPNQLHARDVIRVLDNGVPQNFAPDALIGVDPGAYIVANVSNVVEVAVHTLAGTRSQAISFTDA